jgi:hypothetical protein
MSKNNNQSKEACISIHIKDGETDACMWNGYIHTYNARTHYICM